MASATTTAPDEDLREEIGRIMSGPEPSIERKREAKRLAEAQRKREQKRTTHRIFQGDARAMSEIADETVHLVVTSPPYFNLVDYEAGENGQLGHLDDYEAFLDELDKVWRQCFDLLVPGSRLCVVVGDVCRSRREAGRHHVLPLHADIATRCREIGFEYLTPILWSKIANITTESGGPARFLGKPYEPNGIIKNDVEYILLLRKPGGYRQPTHVQRALSLLEPEEHNRWYRSAWNDIGGKSRTPGGHPAPFPSELAYRLIKMFSFAGDTVLDPFWGTGSTTAAAVQALRSSMGYEVETQYLRAGRERLSQTEALAPADIQFQ